MPTSRNRVPHKALGLVEGGNHGVIERQQYLQGLAAGLGLIQLCASIKLL